MMNEHNNNNNNPENSWKDITKEFQNASEALNLGELVFAKSFSLYEAMSAIELMDPKMDAGMVENRPRVCPFAEMYEKKLIKVEDFTHDELIGIIDDTFSCLATWMDGHSFEQTIYINVYMHDPNLVADKRLKTFCLVILKIVDFLTSSIHRASIYEEEDYQMKPKQVLIENALNHSKYLSLLKSIETDLQKQIDNTKNPEESVYLKAILVRFQFTKNLYVMLNSFRKHTDKDQAQTVLKEFIGAFLTNVSACQKLTGEWSQTLGLGIQPKKDDFVGDSRNQNYPTIMGFEPMINQRLMSPSFPRYTRIKSRPDMLKYLIDFLGRLSDMFRIQELQRFDDVLRSSTSFSKHKPSCIVSRSMLFLFYLSKPDLVFGEVPFVKIVKDFIKQFINPPVMNGEVKMNEELKQMLESFYSRSTIVFGTVIQTYSNNRARQREKIASVLEAFSVLLDEATTLDHFASQQSEIKSFCYFQFWCLRYYMHLQSQYLFSGFELELYLSHEFAYVYFELEYILNYISLMFQKAIDIDDPKLLNGTLNHKSSKKSSKKSGKASKCSNYDHETWLNYYSSYATFSRSMHLICLAFMIEGKIKGPRQNLNSEQIRYEHRFAPLNLFDMVLVGYDKYKTLFENAMKSQPSQLYKSACESLMATRTKLESIKEPSLQSEIQSQLKVVKTNLVVVNLLLSGHNSQATPEFNFDEGYYFPIIKFVK